MANVITPQTSVQTKRFFKRSELASALRGFMNEVRAAGATDPAVIAREAIHRAEQIMLPDSAGGFRIDGATVAMRPMNGYPKAVAVLSLRVGKKTRTRYVIDGEDGLLMEVPVVGVANAYDVDE